MGVTEAHLHLLVAHHAHPVRGARCEFATGFAHAQLADATGGATVGDATQFGGAAGAVATRVARVCVVVVVLFELLLLLLLTGLHGCLLLMWLLCGIEWLHSTNDLGRTLAPQCIQFGAQEPVVVETRLELLMKLLLESLLLLCGVFMLI